MAWIGALIAAGTAIYGDVSAQGNAQAANSDNMQINQNNIDAAMNRQLQAESFNIGQQTQSQQFSASQIAQQEQFQSQQTQDVEAYDTQMSDTSMQRRVQDLQAAGLNPLLAVAQGGASAPVVSAPQGGAAYGTPVTASPASQGSGIPMQNTGQAWGNLGAQMSNALQTRQLGAQIDNLNAQTDKLNAETDTSIPANADYLRSMTGLTDENAKVASSNAQLIADQVKYDTGDSGNHALDWTKNWAQTGAATTNTDILRATKDALISATQSDSTAKALGLAQLRNLNEVQSSKLGEVITYLNTILQPVGTAAGAAGQLLK